MLSIAPLAATTFAPTTSIPSGRLARAAAPVMETVSDLKTLAPKLNPMVGFWDPLKCEERERSSNASTLWLCLHTSD